MVPPSLRRPFPALFIGPTHMESPTSRSCERVTWASSGHAPTRRTGPVPARPTVCAVVVTHNNAHVVDRCVQSLQSALASLTHSVAVVDNASTDNTRQCLERHDDLVELSFNDDNLGFGAAVNQCLHDCDSDFVLLVNPDVVVDRTAVAALLAAARQFPEAGIYGGQAVLPDGSLDPFSRLPLPTLVYALAFALGAPALRWRVRTWAVAGRPVARRGIEEVGAVCGACVLIRASLWHQLGGFDERFFMYGEDVDLCRRAKSLGFAPLHAPEARYVHVGGQSTSTVQRCRLMLTGLATLYHVHMKPERARLALALLCAGTGIRAGLAPLLAAHRAPCWREIWADRHHWRDGWPELAPSAHVGRQDGAASRLVGLGEGPPSRVRACRCGRSRPQ